VFILPGVFKRYFTQWINEDGITFLMIGAMRKKRFCHAIQFSKLVHLAAERKFLEANK